MTETLRVGALISGGGTNLQAVIDSCQQGDIPARVVFVGSDNPEAKGLARAEKAGIPRFVTDYGKILRDFRSAPDTPPPSDFDFDGILGKQRLVSTIDTEKARRYLVSRVLCERALLDRIADFSFDLIILAGFMRVVTPYFIDRISPDPQKPRLMNIHPALLPSFPGVDGYGDTFHYGCKVGGCTVHFVDYGEDSGPIIGQRAFAIEPGDDLDAVKKKGLELEWELYPHCIRLFAEDRLTVKTMPQREGGTRRVVEISSE